MHQTGGANKPAINQNKEWKRLDLLGRKVYSPSTLQLRVANYAALLSNYDCNIHEKISEFIKDIPGNKKEQFKSLINEGQLIARMALQASLDVANTTARTTAMVVVMCRASWLHSAVLPREL